MGVTIIDRLFANLDTLTGKFIRIVGGQRSNDGKARSFLTDQLGNQLQGPGDDVADAFGRARVSQPFNVFDAKQNFDNAPQFYLTSLIGGGTATYLVNQSSTQMGVTAANGDSSIRQSFEYVPYQAGRSQLIFMTGVMGAIKANVRQRIGYFDANNGVFFEQNGTLRRVVVRTFTSGAAVDTAVNQASWNLDTMDGSGNAANPSGILLDTTKNQIFVFDFEWLGAGRIRFGFNINGQTIYVHQVLNANVITLPWSTTGSLPVRWELVNTAATAGATTMLQTCASVFSEGGSDPLGIAAAASNAITPAFAGTAVTNLTPTPIMSIRLKAAFNRAVIVPQGFEVYITSLNSFIAEVFIGGALSGGAAVVTSVSDAAEMVTGNTVLTGGRRIALSLGSNQVRITQSIVQSARRVCADFAGATELLSLVITPTSGNATFYGALSWKEIY